MADQLTEDALRGIGDSLLQNIPENLTMTLVGGRALDFWIAHYADLYPDEFEGLAEEAGTIDLDLVLQNKGDAEIVWRNWEPILRATGRRFTFATPTHDHQTPEMAVINVHIDGDVYPVADFLYNILGYKTAAELETVSVQASKSPMFRVLTPEAILRSRVANILTLPSKRTPESYEQFHNACRIMRCAIAADLEEGDHRSALRKHRRVINLALSKDGRRLCRDEYGLYVAQATVAGHPLWPEEFRAKSWPRDRMRLADRGCLPQRETRLPVADIECAGP